MFAPFCQGLRIHESAVTILVPFRLICWIDFAKCRHSWVHENTSFERSSDFCSVHEKVGLPFTSNTIDICHHRYPWLASDACPGARSSSQISCSSQASQILYWFVCSSLSISFVFPVVWLSGAVRSAASISHISLGLGLQHLDVVWMFTISVILTTFICISYSCILDIASCFGEDFANGRMRFLLRESSVCLVLQFALMRLVETSFERIERSCLKSAISYFLFCLHIFPEICWIWNWRRNSWHSETLILLLDLESCQPQTFLPAL